LVRFLLDENVPRTLGDILRRRGFGVRITTEALGAGVKVMFIDIHPRDPSKARTMIDVD
jgi:hypothetical protein